MRHRDPGSWRSPARRLSAVAVTAALSGMAPASAQAPAYTAAQLDCAIYRGSIESRIHTVSGSQQSQETAGRDALVVFRAGAKGDGSLQMESWFDSLALWRQGGGRRDEAETDGLIGGRFRGTLTRNGSYVAEDRPFIPDEVTAFADISDPPVDLLPPLPPLPLAVRASYIDSSGWSFRRLSDSSAGGQVIRRYELGGHREHAATRTLGDSLTFEVVVKEEEAGTMAWSDREGPLRWRRQIVARSTVPAGGTIRRPIRTRLEQAIVSERVGRCNPE